MKKLLTISIPTWNREFLLQELLKDLTQQVITFSLENSIEILISDNNSEDNTWKLICHYKDKFDFISTNKNDYNIGAKSNVLKSMELANSEYVLFLGDDDRIRKNALPELLNIIRSSPNLGVLIDISNYKYKDQFSNGYLDLSTTLECFYWYMGNASHFVCKTAFFKKFLQKHGYDYFNECWPQTQIMILGLTESKLKPFVIDLNIHIESKHSLVMVYNSYYLWRTCIYDLLISVKTIQDQIPEEIFNSCRQQMKSGIKQNFLNILQCGVFVDDEITKKKTRDDIINKLHMFSLVEKLYLSIIVLALSLPAIISKFISNCFIWITKGKKGIVKKNTFVTGELQKKKKILEQSKQVRSLVFEK